MSKRILITGAAGGVASHIIDRLVEGNDIVGFDMVEGGHPAVEWHVGDITDVDALTEAAAGCDAVVHLAGVPIYAEDKRLTIGRVNIYGTQVVLDAVVRAGVPYYVQASSICALGYIFGRRPIAPEYFPLDEQSTSTPDDAYGISKATDELLANGYAERYGFRATSMRMATVWAPAHGPTRELLTELLDPRYDDDIEYSDLRWQYVDSRDVALAFQLAIENWRRAGRVYNVGAADSPGGDWRVWFNHLYPGVPRLNQPHRLINDPSTPLWSIDLIASDLGYRPQHSWREYPEFVSGWESYLERRSES